MQWEIMFDYTFHQCDQSSYFQREITNLFGKQTPKDMKVVITFQGHSGKSVINEKKDQRSEASKELCLMRVTIEYVYLL